MKYTKTLIISTLAAASIAIGASAMADRGKADHQERMLDRVSSRLELTEGQSAALADLAAEMAETRDLMRGEGDGLRTELGELITSETFDQRKALTLINDRAAAMQANAPELVAAAAVFFDGLTAEQKEQVKAFAERRGHGRFGRHERNGND